MGELNKTSNRTGESYAGHFLFNAETDDKGNLAMFSYVTNGSFEARCLIDQYRRMNSALLSDAKGEFSTSDDEFRRLVQPRLGPLADNEAVQVDFGASERLDPLQAYPIINMLEKIEEFTQMRETNRLGSRETQ